MAPKTGLETPLEADRVRANALNPIDEKKAAIFQDIPLQQNSTALECPVCEHTARLRGRVDFNKSCADRNSPIFSASGLLVDYFQCDTCNFMFAPQMYKWDDAEFLTHVYNDDYVHADPDYVDHRPTTNAEFIHQKLGSQKSQIRHLDYGGGNGQLSKILQDNGWDSKTFDPFPKGERTIENLGTFNLITAFEVFEHVPNPNELMQNLVSLMDQECLVIFSTAISDGAIKSGERLNWWYASPRNGHISLYSALSLSVLATKSGLEFVSWSPNVHAMWNKVPNWAT